MIEVSAAGVYLKSVFIYLRYMQSVSK